MKKTYYIGIDGGGTKTICELFDSNKNSIASVLMPTVHPAQTDKEGAVSILTLAKEKLILNIKDLEYDLKVGAGLGGYGIDKEYRKKLEYEFAAVFDDFKLYSDAYAAMLGALAGEDGILIIAGTGSIGFAKVGNNTYRCGGFGYRYGDEGSAYSIGRELISIAMKEYDGRAKKSTISDIVLEYFKNYSFNEIAISDFGREKIAGLAKKASKNVYNNEIIAKVFEKAAREISLHIIALGKNFKTNQKTKVSYIGGVFRSDYIRELVQKLNPDIELISPIYPPQKGAVLLL